MVRPLLALGSLALVSAGLSGCATGPGPAMAADESSVELAFVSLRDGGAHIYLRDHAGHERRLTDGKTVNTQPSLSPDGQLAYVSMQDRRPVIMLTDTTAGQPRRLTQASDAESTPSWSPDGKAIAYFALDLGTGQNELRIVDTATGKAAHARVPGPSLGPGRPVWSADGQRLVFLGSNNSGRNQVWVIERDGSGLRDISSPHAKRGGVWASLSPDGRRVAWTADMRGRLPLMVTDLTTGKTVDITDGIAAGHESPRWSPDGLRLVVASTRDSPSPARNDIFVMNADGTSVMNVTRHPGEDFDPQWSADGQRIVFASLRTGTSLLYEVSADGGPTRPLSVHPSHDMDHVVRHIALAREPTR